MNKHHGSLKLSSHVTLKDLKTIPVGQRFDFLPLFLKEIVFQARASIALEELIVFGSRARGDERPLSDWDLCFKFPTGKRTEWLRFSLDLPEKANTLLDIDAVDWNEAPEALKAAILREGLTIWKKSDQPQDTES
ncbi:MAG: nucleotidyltransferase domain-containing protein [Betaproteobacteria bacterium]|nr:nucleotidyltransferase domain-containing protein [Betaproteobacteria bacterium]